MTERMGCGFVGGDKTRQYDRYVRYVGYVRYDGYERAVS
jgi:hypothetical protein